MRLIPASSHVDKSHHMNQPFWPLWSLQSNIVDSEALESWKFMIPVTSSYEFKLVFIFLGQVPATCSSKRVVWIVCGTSPCNQTLCVNSSGDKSQILVSRRDLSHALILLVFWVFGNFSISLSTEEAPVCFEPHFVHWYLHFHPGFVHIFSHLRVAKVRAVASLWTFAYVRT